MTTANILSQLGSPGVSTGFKNRILNGQMVIDQRNGGVSVSVASGTAPYTLDRWVAYNNATNTYTVQQTTTAPAGFSKSLVFTNNASATSSTAGMYQLLGQRIEGYNIADLNWGTANAKTVTVSFWAYTSQSGTYGGVVRCGAANNRFYGFSFTLPANTWTQVTTTILGDTSGTYTTDNTNGIELLICLSCGSGLVGSAGSWTGTQLLGITGQTQFNATGSATFYITGVQLEVGTTATNFEVRSYGTELALCQRYCYVLSFAAANSPVCFGNNFSTSNFYGGLVFPVTMRVAPATTFATPSNYNVLFSGTSAAGTLNQGITTAYQTEIYTTGTGLTAGAGAWVRTGASTVSQIIISAEL